MEKGKIGPLSRNAKSCIISTHMVFKNVSVIKEIGRSIKEVKIEGYIYIYIYMLH